MKYIQLKTTLPGPKGLAMLERRKNALPAGLAKSTDVVVERAEGALVWDVTETSYWILPVALV